MFLNPHRFVETAFPDIDLGDLRLNKRLHNVATDALRHPQESLPDKFAKPKDDFASLDFFDHLSVTHERMLEAHQVALLLRLEAERPKVVLMIHDTTDLDFSGHKTLHDDLIPIGNGGGQGWLCHNSLAIEPQSRQILGLTSQILHVRPKVPKNEPVAARRERTNRESRLGLRGVDEIGRLPRKNCGFIWPTEGRTSLSFFRRWTIVRSIIWFVPAKTAGWSMTWVNRRPNCCMIGCEGCRRLLCWTVDVGATKTRKANRQGPSECGEGEAAAAA